jgi:reactive chlorine resistance protein C
MSEMTMHRPTTEVVPTHRLTRAGLWIVRYGLVVVIAWIGALKFTAYEANAIQPLVAHHPLMSWLYDVLSVRAFANVLGTLEVLTAILVALVAWVPRISAIGSGFAVLLFLSTLSFLLTTPGVAEPTAGGLPVLSVLPGQFLLKDLVLMGAALWTLGDSLDRARQRAAM